MTAERLLALQAMGALAHFLSVSGLRVLPERIYKPLPAETLFLRRTSTLPDKSQDLIF